MAFNFSANQFEDGYQAKRLRNWEVPKWFPAHPRTPLTTTQFIADSRGHLLPGVPKANPWGNYKNTWELPRRITKTYAQHFNTQPKKLEEKWSKRRAPPEIQPQITQSEPEKLPVLSQTSVESFTKRNKSSSALDDRSPTPSKVQPLKPLTPQQLTPNIPARTLNEKIKNILAENEQSTEKQETTPLCRAIETLPKACEEVEEEKLEDMKGKETLSEKKTYGGILMNDYSTFQIAKRYHDENLKHQPLPDVVDDPVFKALASNKHPFPGKALEIQPNAAAVGCKGAQGPTKCSKVKVYRPKTCAVKPRSHEKDQRPKTCDPQKEKRFEPINLAICWDLAPEEKPRRGQHIDGSQGGEAPAVFAVVKPEDREIFVAGSPQAVAAHVPTSVEENNVGTLPPKIGEKVQQQTKCVTNKSAILAHVKPAEESPPVSFHSLSPESAEIARKNPKTAWTNYDTSKELSHRLQELEHNSRKGDSHNLNKAKNYKSTPNLTTIDQGEKKCEGSNCGTETNSDKKVGSVSAPEKKPGSRRDTKEYKMAFKAGMPQNGHSPQPQKPVKMPKMRPPYAKKNYAINTLIPPFSLWPDHHGQEYPEHWRLASVYQHSYKPVDARRKPLLASVFQ